MVHLVGEQSRRERDVDEPGASHGSTREKVVVLGQRLKEGDVSAQEYGWATRQ